MCLSLTLLSMLEVDADSACSRQCHVQEEWFSEKASAPHFYLMCKCYKANVGSTFAYVSCSQPPHLLLHPAIIAYTILDIFFADLINPVSSPLPDRLGVLLSRLHIVVCSDAVYSQKLRYREHNMLLTYYKEYAIKQG